MPFAIARTVELREVGQDPQRMVGMPVRQPAIVTGEDPQQVEGLVPGGSPRCCTDTQYRRQPCPHIVVSDGITRRSIHRDSRFAYQHLDQLDHACRLWPGQVAQQRQTTLTVCGISLDHLTLDICPDPGEQVRAHPGATNTPAQLGDIAYKHASSLIAERRPELIHIPAVASQADSCPEKRFVRQNVRDHPDDAQMPYEDAVIDERLDASQEDSPGHTEEIAHYIEQSTILQTDRCKRAQQGQDLARLFAREARYACAHHVAELVQDLLPEVGIERQSRGLQAAGRDHGYRDDRHKWAVACCVSEDIDEFLTQCQPRCSG